MHISKTSLSQPTRYHPGQWEWCPSSRELTARGIHLNPGKTVALAPKEHVPTPEETSLLAGVGVHNADEGGIKVAGVPVGTDELGIENAKGIVRDDGVEQLARMLVRTQRC